MNIASSRIFVRNLPPSLTDADFRKHFSRGTDLTDAKFFKHRRIGYVGYKTAEEAAKAVKYFNKSFIRMSRISVELAKPVESDAQEEAQIETKNTLKRKRDDQKPDPDPKLSEFLGVMGSKKARTWQNETIDEVEPLVKLPEEEESDEEMQVIGQSNEPEKDEIPIKAPLPKINNSNVSDTDWLKSKAKVLVDDDLENVQEDAAEEDDDSKEKHKTILTAPKPVAAPDPADGPAEKISKTRRLYLRNLPFSATEEDIREKFSEFGDVQEVHMPMSSGNGKSRGFAFVLYYNGEDAVQAWQNMDGKTFQGRLIHILPAEPKADQLDEFAISQLPLKQQNAIKRKLESSAATYKWNPLYMNMDNVMSSMAARLGVNKSEILDPTSSDAAVKQALAETHVIQEAKTYFAKNGVELDSFKPGKPRGDTAILVKNFPHGTSADEIRKMFSPHGEIIRLLIPPSSTMALVEFSNSSQGKSAFNSLKYKRVGDTILFLEKAPKNVFSNSAPITSTTDLDLAPKVSTSDLLQGTSVDGETNTLFVRNLNFSTRNEDLAHAFEHISGFLTARVKTKTNPKDPNQPLSLGFGFVEFKSAQDAQVALKLMNGKDLKGFKLDIRPSQKALDAAQEKRKEEKARNVASMHTKVVVKNLPFEANKKEIRTLLASYGRVRSVRLPKKFDSSSRGFAFVEFTTPKEAANAMEALRNTHLLGRRLHIEYASVENMDAEAEIEQMQKKVGSQVHKVAMQINSSRKRFSMGEGEEDVR